MNMYFYTYHIIYTSPGIIASNVHVIVVIEYVDKQEKYMTAKEMERM